MDYEDEKQTTTHIVAAQPGWNVVEPVTCDCLEETGECDHPGYCREPIIAWAITITADRNGPEYVAPVPVTAEWGFYNGWLDMVLIERPDSTLLVPDDRTFDDIKEAVRYLEDKRAERRKIRAARKERQAGAAAR